MVELGGIDGVGKSTQADLLVQNLCARGVKAAALGPRRFSREVAKAWAKYQRNGDAGVSHETLALASAAALMFQHDRYRRSNMPVDLFVADRYLLSIFAYNAVRGADMDYIHGVFSKLPLSEVGVLLTLDSSEAASRVSARSGSPDFEERDARLQMTLQDEFLRIVPDSWMVLDASQDIVWLSSTILEYVMSNLSSIGATAVG